MNGCVSLPYIIGNMAESEITIKVTEIAIEYGTGIDNHNVTGLGLTLGRTHDDAVVSSST